MNIRTIFVLAMLTASSAFGELTWEQSEFVFHPGINDEKVSALYKFTNTGDTSVTITSIKTGCACTTTELEKYTYAPGESGELEATFAYDLRTGLQTKRVLVVTDPISTPTTKLYIKVHIPQVLKMKPWMVYWYPDKHVESKQVRITVPGEEPISIDRAAVNGKGVVVELETVKPGKEYLLTLTPDEHAESGDVIVRLHTDRPEEADKDFKGFRVRARFLPPASAEDDDLYAVDAAEAIPSADADDGDVAGGTSSDSMPRE